MELQKKNTWNKESGYIWSLIGSAVGFANVLSFSALCYKNGGGAFLFPYFFAHLIVGIPMLFFEGLIGQRTGLPLVSALGKVGGTKAKTWGWIAIFSCATIGGFYIVLTGFAVAYIYFSVQGKIPFDTAYFFKYTFLRDSGNIAQWGEMATGVFIATLVVALFSWIVLSRNIQKGIEKLSSLFLPLLGIFIAVFTTITLFLPGAFIGIRHYLLPDFSRLLDWTLWRDVFGQVFFSLSLGLGIVVGYSRHNPPTFNLSRAMVRVACGDFIISFVAGLAIFGCMGFLHVKTGMAFSQLITSDSAFEIGFVIFPIILKQFGPLVFKWVAPLFFFCIFIAGVTGVFSIVESIVGNIIVEFRKQRKVAVSIAMAGMVLLAFPFCWGNGQYLIGALVPMVLGNLMLFGGIVEIVLLLLLFKEIYTDPLWLSKGRRSYAFYSLKYVVLPLLVMSLIGALYREAYAPKTLYEAVRWGWLGIVLLLSFTLSYQEKRASVKLPELS